MEGRRAVGELDPLPVRVLEGRVEVLLDAEARLGEGRAEDGARLVQGFVVNVLVEGPVLAESREAA